MTTIDKSQLPEGARLSVGDTGKEVKGVIEEGFVRDGNILAAQAERFLAQRSEQGAQTYQQGASFNQEIIERVSKNAFQGMVDLNAETIQALQQGQINRDGTFAGNNANFTGYYLEPAAKFVIPQMTPFRNMVPRDAMPGIDTVNWRTVLDYFGGNGPTVAGAAIQQFGTPNGLSYQFANMSNVAKMLGYKDTVSFESEIYGRMWQGDVRATVAAKLIPALMQEEEMWLLNSGQKLWAPSPPLATPAITGGSLAAATYWILVTAVNANGETLAYQTTAVSSVVASGTTGSIALTIFTVPSAVSYNVYVGTGSTQPANSAMWRQAAAGNFGSASALNQPTTTIRQGYFTATLTSNATSGTAYSTVVTAGNTSIVVKSTETNTLNLPLTFDGAQALIYNSFGPGGSLGIQGETPLVAQPASAGGTFQLTDLDTVLENMALSAHADPEYLFCGIKDHKTLSLRVAAGTNFRVTQQNGPAMADLTGGQRVTKYINQTTGRLMDVVMLPYLGQGTMMIGSFSIPFPVSAIEKPPFRVAVNRDMWAVEYPPDQGHMTQWQYAAYLNETLINQYLGGWALLTGITLT